MAIGLGLVAIYVIATAGLSYYPIISLLKSFSLLLMAGVVLLVVPTLQILYPRVGATGYILQMYSYLAVIIVLSNAIYFFLMPSSSNQYFSGSSFLLGRYRGWFVNPNDLAGIYGVLFLPVLFSQMLRETKVVKTGLYLTFLIAVIQLAATNSRAGISAGIISVGILALGVKRWPAATVAGLVIGAASVTYFVGSETNFMETFFFRGQREADFTSGRLPVWNKIWADFLTHPFLGSGLGVANLSGGGTGDRVAFSSSEFTIEKGNSYLGALEELGIAGCTILVATLVVPLLNVCYNGVKNGDKRNDLGHLTTIAVVIAGLGNALFEAWLLSIGNFISLSFWIFAALTFTCKAAPKRYG